MPTRHKLSVAEEKYIIKKYHQGAKLLLMVMHTVGDFTALGFNRTAIYKYCKKYIKHND